MGAMSLSFLSVFRLNYNVLVQKEILEGLLSAAGSQAEMPPETLWPSYDFSSAMPCRAAIVWLPGVQAG